MITLNTNILKAALQCAAKKDVRYYLNSVCLRVNTAGEVFIMSSDGSVAFVSKHPANWTGEPQKGPFDLLIPREAVETAVKTKSATLDLVAMPDGRYLLGGTVFTAVDGKFPDLDRVVPEKVSGELYQFNPELLVIANKALNLAGSGKYHVLHHNGSSSAVMCADDGDSFVVVMGMRPSAMSGNTFNTFKIGV